MITIKINVFVHIILPNFYNKILKIEPNLPKISPFINHPHMSNVNLRKENLDKNVKQIISSVNICPEDYLNPEDAAKMCRDANLEMNLIDLEVLRILMLKRKRQFRI